MDRRGGKGSHRNFTHTKVIKVVTIVGNLETTGSNQGGKEMRKGSDYLKIVE
jgi:hypothetical protein